ncbi:MULTISPECIES: hypothetical protein [unclassified Nocardia]|uniref:hypothetical protein n=1 Tax=unclassified Nocardia TaxID=2637762 RepID=UPI001CE3D391|nr:MULTISPECIES: hypothetical protein [unclassified Nocardia]
MDEILVSQEPITPCPYAETALLLALLLMKFGVIPMWLDHDVRCADTEQCRTWMNRLLAGGSFEQIIYGEEQARAQPESQAKLRNLVNTWEEKTGSMEGFVDALFDVLIKKSGPKPGPADVESSDPDRAGP